MKLQAQTFIYTTDDGKRYDVYFTKAAPKGYVATIVHDGKAVHSQASPLANNTYAQIILNNHLS